MENNYNNIDKLFESARKFKSPVSIDKARNLIEMKDLYHIDKLSFFSIKGVKIMTFSSLLISSFLIYSLNTGIFQNDKSIIKQHSKDSQIVANFDTGKSNILSENSTNNSSDQKSNTEYQSSENSKANDSEANVTFLTIQDKNDKIQGMNTIVLTEKELEKFNMKIDSLDNNGKKFYGISFWNKISDKNAIYMTFSLGGGSTHKFVDLANEENVKFPTISPQVFTDFKGTIIFQTSGILQNSNEVDEFMEFKDKFIEFNNLEFKKESFPDNFPPKIDADLKELNKLFAEYQFSNNDPSVIGVKINNKLNSINQYFTQLTEKKETNFSSDKDSNIQADIVIYIENEPTQNELDYRETMKKQGLNVTYEKRKMNIKEFLKTNYSDLESSMNSIQKQIEQFILVNKMIAVEIPIKQSPDNQGFILWFTPSQELIDNLPSRYRKELANEFKLLENEDAVCGTKIESEKTFLDVWRACSGAIENLRVFPNPVKNILNIKFELKEKRNIHFAIHNINGDKIKDISNKQSANSGTNSYTFDISDLRTGLYLIVVSSDNMEQAVQRIIKE